MPRRRTYPDDLRDRLLAAAFARLCAHTAEEVSLRDLAAECGTSTNAIYAIFGGKDQLIAQVVQRARKELLDCVLGHHDPAFGLESFATAGFRYRAWAREHPGLYRLAFEGSPERGGPIAVDTEDGAHLYALLEGLMAAGVLRPIDPASLVITLWTSLHGFTLLELSAWPDGSPEADTYFAAVQSHLASGVLTSEALQAVSPAERWAAALTPAASD